MIIVFSNKNMQTPEIVFQLTALFPFQSRSNPFYNYSRPFHYFYCPAFAAGYLSQSNIYLLIHF